MDSYREVGNYELSTLCMESYPCQHYVKFKNGNTRLFTSDIIYRIFKSEGLSDPHIDKYAEFVRQHDFPTPEEIVIIKNMKLKNQEVIEKREKEADEKQKIINQYKASSRIDKLKKQNNVTE